MMFSAICTCACDAIVLNALNYDRLDDFPALLAREALILESRCRDYEGRGKLLKSRETGNPWNCSPDFEVMIAHIESTANRRFHVQRSPNYSQPISLVETSQFYEDHDQTIQYSNVK